jgi:REP element-mobilizing transposase RayT
MPNSLAKLQYHVVFSTRQRQPLIRPDLQRELYAYMDGIVRDRKGALVAVGGMPDHVHLLLRLRAYTPVAQILRVLKAGTSKWLKERKGFSGGFAWQRGYGAFSVSESNVPTLKLYIQSQEAHHRKMSSREEMIRILRKHGLQVVGSLDD